MQFFDSQHCLVDQHYINSFCFFPPPQSRTDLEQHSVDTASTSDAVTFITYVQNLKRKYRAWEKQVEVC